MTVSKSAVLGLRFSLDGEPFVHATPRDEIDTLGLDFAFEGAPFLAPATRIVPTSGWGVTALVRPWAATGRAP